jgi:hypothetical protein
LLVPQGLVASTVGQGQAQGIEGAIVMASLLKVYVERPLNAVVLEWVIGLVPVVSRPRIIPLSKVPG